MSSQAISIDESHSHPADSSSEIAWTILVPVFNDWTAADLLIDQLDAVFAEQGLSGQVVLVNDGSTEPIPTEFPRTPPQQLTKITVLELRKNLGHQRALSVGLVYLFGSNPYDPVLIMDADGEDGPADIPILVKEYVRHGRRKMIFAARARRTEGFVFKLFYQIYRAIHYLLVGFDIRIGNFSAVPAAFLERLVVNSDLWNHYAASVIKMKLPCATVPIDRSKRLYGQSTMGFVGLVIHGLSAISVFGDIVGVRLLIASGFFGLVTKRPAADLNGSEFFRSDQLIEHAQRNSEAESCIRAGIQNARQHNFS